MTTHNPPGMDLQGLRTVAAGELERLSRALSKRRRTADRVVFTQRNFDAVVDALENLYDLIGERREHAPRSGRPRKG